MSSVLHSDTSSSSKHSQLSACPATHRQYGMPHQHAHAPRTTILPHPSHVVTRISRPPLVCDDSKQLVVTLEFSWQAEADWSPGILYYRGAASRAAATATAAAAATATAAAATTTGGSRPSPAATINGHRKRAS